MVSIFQAAKLQRPLVIYFMAFPDNNLLYFFFCKTATESWNSVETFARHLNPASKVKSLAFSFSLEFNYHEKETSKSAFFSTFSLIEPIVSTIPLFS